MRQIAVDVEPAVNAAPDIRFTWKRMKMVLIILK